MMTKVAEIKDVIDRALKTQDDGLAKACLAELGNHGDDCELKIELKKLVGRKFQGLHY